MKSSLISSLGERANALSLLRRIVCFILSGFLCLAVRSSAYEAQIDSLAQDLSAYIDPAGNVTLAVVDFADLNGQATELGRFVAEELSAALAEHQPRFYVVERTYLKHVLQEHKLAATGLIDAETVREVGKISGASVVVSGTIAPLGESVRISARILDTESALVVGATRGNIPMTRAIAELLGRVVSEDFPSPPALSENAPVISKIETIDENSSTGLVIVQKVYFSDPQGDVMFVNFDLVSTNWPNALVIGGPVRNSSEDQKRGTFVVGRWECRNSISSTTLRVSLLDREGNTSNGIKFTLDCHIGS